MPDFDEARFDELVLYIAHATKDDPRFGRTKLAKVLFYADFDAYREGGESMTGATYIRMPFGPFPAQLKDAEGRLERSGRAILDYDIETKEEKKIRPLKNAEHVGGFYRVFELRAIDLWIEAIAKGTARQVSDESHDHSGWIIAEHVGATIPYATAFLPESVPDRRDIDRATRVARSREWLTDAGWQWEREPT
jgi:hypothetical protein